MKPFDLHTHNKINSGFKTPEGYHAQLTQQIVANCIKDSKKKSFVFTLPKLGWAAAASLLIAGFITYQMMERQNEAKLSSADLEYYLISNTSEEDLSKLLNQEDINQLENAITLNKEEVSHYIENYSEHY
ncbi:MAG: hypothetical protein KBS98_00430 [Flavobacterium sp.]|nr:hypothetical protein [Candidatus Neoflavobacterium equi]